MLFYANSYDFIFESGNRGDFVYNFGHIPCIRRIGVSKMPIYFTISGKKTNLIETKFPIQKNRFHGNGTNLIANWCWCAENEFVQPRKITAFKLKRMKWWNGKPIMPEVIIINAHAWCGHSKNCIVTATEMLSISIQYFVQVCQWRCFSKNVFFCKEHVNHP